MAKSSTRLTRSTRHINVESVSDKFIILFFLTGEVMY